MKGLFMTESFWEGFTKVARLHEDAGTNSTRDGLIGLIPFGTTISTLAEDRPEGHSRLREWGGRVVGGVGGNLAGNLAGGALGFATGLATRTHPRMTSSIGALLGGIGGAFTGERLMSKAINKDYYDEEGELKKEYRKSDQIIKKNKKRP